MIFAFFLRFFPRISYSHLVYEGGAFKSETGAIFLQPLGADHATMPHMKGI